MTQLLTTRRKWLQWTAVVAACDTLQRRLIAEESAAKLEPLRPLNRFPRMVQEYFVTEVARAEQIGQKLRAELKTQVDAQRYIESVRRHIQESFGPWPEKTPLNPRITGTVDRQTYRIEKVVFESRPQFFVTANLYVPQGQPFPLPGVVGSCGHSENGKAAAAYQSFAQGLAKLGYVVLIFDPIGQGERLQYPDEHTHSRFGAGVGEHLQAGNQQYLVGEFFGSWRAWDGIRALDYLLSRSEVDPQRVGITGNSGGGTMTTWLAGVDQRWSMAAPSCFVTTFRRNLENELPADTEQCPPKAIALGLDHADFLAALAPKPVIILAQEKDYFDVRGSEEAYARLKSLYTLLGVPDNVQLFVGPQEHGYSVENREAMYGFFHRATGQGTTTTEPEITFEPDATLQCLPTGQVAELSSKTVFDFTRAKSESLRKSRTGISAEKLPAILSDVLKLPTRTTPPRYRIFRPLPDRSYPLPHAAQYGVETEPGILAVVTRLGKTRLLSRPLQAGACCLLYVSHHSADSELREESLLRELLAAEPDATLFAVDLRGIGDSQPDTCGHEAFLSSYGSDYFYAAHALMLDRPYPGMRTHDLLRVLDWIKDLGFAKVHLAARGWGTIPATFAAVISPVVTQVTLKNSLTSYAELAESAEYAWPLSSLTPAILQHCDLPDCYRALEGKALRRVEPWGSRMGM